LEGTSLFFMCTCSSSCNMINLKRVICARFAFSPNLSKNAALFEETEEAKWKFTSFWWNFRKLRNSLAAFAFKSVCVLSFWTIKHRLQTKRLSLVFFVADHFSEAARRSQALQVSARGGHKPGIHSSMILQFFRPGSGVAFYRRQ